MRSAQRRSSLHDTMQRKQALGHFDDRSSFDAVASDEYVEVGARCNRKTLKEQRVAIELAFFASMTQAEIAEYLDQPLGTIKARIRRECWRCAK